MTEEKLMAFVDGELSADEAEVVRAAVAADPALKARVEQMRALNSMLSRTYDPVLDEKVPERLAQAARPSNVVSFGARSAARPQWSVREWGAMAASVAGGLVIGLGAMRALDPGLVEANAQGLVARGALASALERAQAADTGAVRIGLSFRATDGRYCRTFTARELAGMACRNADTWRVEIAEAHTESASDYRQAGSELSPAIRSAVEAVIEGEPFDAAAEAAAREKRWRD